MIVISDTSPIHYLVLIDAIDVLPSLFGEVLIPTAAHGELLHAHAPLPVRQWAATPPPWLTISPTLNVNPQLPLGIGEAEAISLAEEMSASLVLMDDRRARREAEARGLAVAGTIAVLEHAAKRNLLQLATAIGKLRQTNFHIAEEILQRALKEDAHRRGES